MAKKKTENIKAAPVLRSGGEDPTPEQTGTRTYQIMDPWKDRDVVNLVDVKAVDGEITDVKVNGQSAGGGGASLVKVSFINTTSEEIEVNVVYLAKASGPVPAHLDFYLNVDANATKEVDAVALGEYSKIMVIGKTISAVTGEITIDTGGLATIHGPGSATISAGA